MQTFISLLRGINVSGHRKVAMKELKEAYAALAFANVETYVQSGNVVFDSPLRSALEVSRLIETQLEGCLGFPVPVLVRKRSEFGRVIEGNPFSQARKEDPAKLHVTFLAARPSASAAANLETTKHQADEFVLREQEIYLFCPNGYGSTRFSNNFFETKLKVAATTRNWKTVQALYALATER